MSHGPTARIYYGYDMRDMTIYHHDGATYDDKYEELAPEWWSDEDPNEHLAKLRGYETWRDPSDDEPVEMESYGYLQGGDYCWTVQVRASVQSLYYYESKPLALPFDVDPAWNEQLRVYAEEMSLILPRNTAPGWHFNCSYDG